MRIHSQTIEVTDDEAVHILHNLDRRDVVIDVFNSDFELVSFSVNKISKDACDIRIGCYVLEPNFHWEAGSFRTYKVVVAG